MMTEFGPEPMIEGSSSARLPAPEDAFDDLLESDSPHPRHGGAHGRGNAEAVISEARLMSALGADLTSSSCEGYVPEPEIRISP
jgi:hypothetical protein